MVSSYYNPHYSKLDSSTFFALGGDSAFVDHFINAQSNAIGAIHEDVWSYGGVKGYLTSAETMDIVSSSANDTSAGTGAQTVIIYGLDGSYNEIEETITMNGVTPTVTSNSFLRVHRIDVATAGTTGENEGTISVTATTAAIPQGEIQVSYNRSVMSHYTIPAGKFGVFQGLHLSVPNGGAGTNLEDCLVHLEGRELNGVFQKDISIYASAGGYSVEPASEISFPEKSDIKLTGMRVDTVDCRLTANYSLLLVDNTIIT